MRISWVMEECSTDQRAGISSFDPFSASAHTESQRRRLGQLRALKQARG